MRRTTLAGLLFCLTAFCQEPPQPLDGPNNPMQDDLLDQLVGSWRMSGKIMGRSVRHQLDAEWVLKHQFLKVHQNGLPDYEATVYIGYDNASERYVAHWLDVYGGRFSENLGYGVKSGNSIRFTFEYPDGPFHNTFTWNPQTRTWRFLLEEKDKKGAWINFATEDLVRVR